MRTCGLTLLAALAGPLACAEDDPSAACFGDRPVQVLANDGAGSFARATADGTLIVSYPYLDGDAPLDGTYGGPDCGAEQTLALPGIHLAPERAALDPADDDPSIACDAGHGVLFRVDLAGASGPRLLLPHLRCPAIPTRHGPIYPTVGHDDRPLLLVPDFPDDSTAVAVGFSGGALQVVDDWLYNIGGDDALHRTNLATLTREAVHARVASFRATATHALVVSSVDPDTAPVHVVDVAAGASAYVGLYRRADDSHLGEPRTAYAWDFDPSGRFVVHAGAFPSPMAAYDLHGAAVAFPAQGGPLLAHPNGTYVIRDAAGAIAARPGDAAGVRLDVDAGELRVVGERLEGLIDGDLHEIPLDGSPRRLLARAIGETYLWLDDNHILTLDDRGVLATVHATTGVRRVHGTSIAMFERSPGRGVYFDVHRDPGDPDNGLWFVPEAALYPRYMACPTRYWCR